MQKSREMTVKAKIECARNPLEDESTSLLARFIQSTQGRKIDIVKEFYHFIAKFLPKFAKILEFLTKEPSYDKLVGLICLICFLKKSFSIFLRYLSKYCCIYSLKAEEPADPGCNLLELEPLS